MRVNKPINSDLTCGHAQSPVCRSLCVQVSSWAWLSGPVDVTWVGVGVPPFGVSFDLCHTPSIGVTEAFQVRLMRWMTQVDGRHNLARGEYCLHGQMWLCFHKAFSRVYETQSGKFCMATWRARNMLWQSIHILRYPRNPGYFLFLDR